MSTKARGTPVIVPFQRDTLASTHSLQAFATGGAEKVGFGRVSHPDMEFFPRKYGT